MTKMLVLRVLATALLFSSAMSAVSGELPSLLHPECGKLIELPAGEFVMGAKEDDFLAQAYEKPSFTAKIRRPIFIGAYEVTVGQFRRFVVATGYKTHGERTGSGGYDVATKQLLHHQKFNWRTPGIEQTDQHPVVCVTWDDAVAYCQWVSDKDGKRKFRLPTEAEWEYAARAGTRTLWSHGDTERSLILKENIADRSLVIALSASRPLEQNFARGASEWNDRYSFSAPVGTFKPNHWGIYDTGGNVDEWVEDFFDPDQYVRSDAKPPTKGTERVHRGGAWIFSARDARCSHRGHRPPTDAWCHLGFRVVTEVD